MPIFEYVCETCERIFERLTFRQQGGAPTPCPACGSVQTTKVFSTFSTQAGTAANVTGNTGAAAFR